MRTSLGLAAMLALFAAPAYATGAVPIPEPTSLSLLGLAAAGVVIGGRLIRRK